MKRLYLIFNRHPERSEESAFEKQTLRYAQCGKVIRGVYPERNKGLRMTPGFTLLELIIAMGVLSFAIALIIYAFTESMHIFTNEIAERDTAIQMNRSIDRMTKELRNALEIESANPTSITFWYGDLNGNGTREDNETVVYSWSGTIEGFLNRTVQNSTLEVASGIKNFSLTYDNAVTANIKLVNISITVQKNSSVSTLESSVKFRNL